MSKKSALGKGLSALISDAEGIKSENNYDITSNNVNKSHFISNPIVFTEIALEKIINNPFQPRTIFEREALKDLSESIKQLGLIQPITVRNIGGRYQIISGERRFRAAQLAGLSKIPAYIRKTDDQGMIEMAIVENIQRENLDPIEIAISFQRLINECNLTQEAMAEKVGKKRATITNYLRLLKLPPVIQTALRDQKISMGHAKALLTLEDEEEQLKICQEIEKKDLSVRQVEKKVQEDTTKKEKPSNKKEEELPESYHRVLNILENYFPDKINVKRSDRGKGHFTIRFSNDQEVESFLRDIEKLTL